MNNDYQFVMNITPASSGALYAFCWKLFYLSMTFMILLTINIRIL